MLANAEQSVRMPYRSRPTMSCWRNGGAWSSESRQGGPDLYISEGLERLQRYGSIAAGRPTCCMADRRRSLLCRDETCRLLNTMDGITRHLRQRFHPASR